MRTPKILPLYSAITFCLLIIAAPAHAETVVVGFPAEDQQRLQIVADDISAIVRDLFGSAPPIDRPIVVYRLETGVPVTSLDNWEHPSVILIGINVVGPKWDQFAYQLGHELGHVMLNPRRTNGLIETLCMAVAYEALDRMSVKWGSSAAPASIPQAGVYASFFCATGSKTNTSTCPVSRLTSTWLSSNMIGPCLKYIFSNTVLKWTS